MESNTKLYKLKIAYNGSKFAGFAIQPKNFRTVQKEVQDLLSIILNEPIKIVGSGRTDKHVHALEQVCSFKAQNKNNISCAKILAFLQKQKIADIFFLDLKQTKNDFHAQFCAKSKTYAYLINFKPDIYFLHQAWTVQQPIDLQKLQAIAQHFIGEHNFWSFSTAEAKAINNDSFRKINFIKFKKTKKFLTIEINANGFMRSMVRMLVGAWINYAIGLVSQEYILNNLKNPKKGNIKFKAPAQGLYLKKIYY